MAAQVDAKVAPTAVPVAAAVAVAGAAVATAAAAVDVKDEFEMSNEPDFEFVSEYACVLRVIKGQDLPAMDLNGKSDPYVVVTIDGMTRRSKIANNTCDPEWNEQFAFVLPQKPKHLTLTAFDYDGATADDKMGHTALDLTPFTVPKAKPVAGAGAAAAAAAPVSAGKKLAQENAVYNGWLKLEGVPKTHTKPALIWVRFECNEIQKAVRRKKEAMGVDGVDIQQLTALLDVSVAGARNLKHGGIFGSSCRAFAKLTMGHFTFFTNNIKSASPTWNAHCPVWIGQSDPLLTISVCDGVDKNKATAVGQVYIRPSFFEEGKAYDLWLPLVKDSPTTDAELSKMMEGMQALTLKALDDDKKTAAVHLVIVKKPKAKVQEAFYTGIIDAYDVDKNGTIELEELLHMCHTLGSNMSDAEVEAIFRGADKDGSKKLRKDELYRLFANGKFQSADLLRKLYSVMTYGKDGLQHLTMRGCFVAADGDFEDEKGHAAVDTAAVEKVLVYDRDTQLIVKENIPTYIKSGMQLLYRSSTPSAAVTAVFKKMTQTEGAKMDLPASAANIPSFVKTHNLNVNEILVQPLSAFKTFNEFFYRKLKAGARVCAAPADDRVAVSPADCRLMVFETLDEAKRLWIKGAGFDLQSLFGAADNAAGDLAKQFVGGSLVICRLAPQDYHRWHMPVSGVPGKRTLIDGAYYTVNPIAIRKNVDVYTANKRCVVPVQTREFGTVVMIAVGATMVGSIHFCCPKNGGADCQAVDGSCCAGTRHAKFAEHGYFAFGGSTVLVLFRPGAILFDKDLIQNSNNQLETLVRVGSQLGTATHK